MIAAWLLTAQTQAAPPATALAMLRRIEGVYRKGPGFKIHLSILIGDRPPAPGTFTWQRDGTRQFTLGDGLSVYEFRTIGPRGMELNYVERTFHLADDPDRVPFGEALEGAEWYYPRILTVPWTFMYDQAKLSMKGQTVTAKLESGGDTDTFTFVAESNGRLKSLGIESHNARGEMKMAWTFLKHEAVPAGFAKLTLDPPNGFAPLYLPEPAPTIEPGLPLPKLNLDGKDSKELWSKQPLLLVVLPERDEPAGILAQTKALVDDLQSRIGASVTVRSVSVPPAWTIAEGPTVLLVDKRGIVAQTWIGLDPEWQADVAEEIILAARLVNKGVRPPDY